jgi:hypothetical protein
MPIIRNATFYQREKRYSDATAMLDDVRKAQQLIGATRPPDSSPATPLPSATTRPMTANDTASGASASVDLAPANKRSLNTPLPYRPSPPQPQLQDANTQPLETSPTDTTPPPKKRNDQILYYLIVILVLLVGVSIKKSLKQAEDGASSPPLEATKAPVRASTKPTVKAEDPAKTDPPATTSTPRETAPPEPPRVEPPKQQPSMGDSPRPSPEARPPAPKPDPPAAGETAEPTNRGPASISNSTGKMARIGGFLPLQAKLVNVRPIDMRTYRVTAYYRAAGSAAYKNTELNRTKTTWTGSIQITPDMEGGLEYFLKGKSNDSSGRLTPLESGSKTSPHRVKISSP